MTVNTGQRDYPGENWTGGNPSWVPFFSVSVLALLLSWFVFLEQCVSLDNFCIYDLGHMYGMSATT